MWILRLLFRRSSDSPLSRLAGEIADRSFDPLWARLNVLAMSMPHDEARGYVRARALPIVDAELCAAVRGKPLPAGISRAELFAQALDAVVIATVRELARRSWSPRVWRRAA
jgi:hypothetical protein